LRAERLREYAVEALPGVGFARVISVLMRECRWGTRERERRFRL